MLMMEYHFKYNALISSGGLISGRIQLQGVRLYPDSIFLKKYCNFGSPLPNKGGAIYTIK